MALSSLICLYVFAIDYWKNCLSFEERKQLGASLIDNWGTRVYTWACACIMYAVFKPFFILPPKKSFSKRLEVITWDFHFYILENDLYYNEYVYICVYNIFVIIKI